MRVTLRHRQTLALHLDDQGFLGYARGLSEQIPSAVLLSGGDLDCARYSLVGWDPFLSLSTKGNRLSVVRDGQRETLEGDPFDLLDRLYASLDFELPFLPPFSGGGMGYLAYDLKNHIERLPQTAPDRLALPDLFWFFPRQILIHDRVEGSLEWLVLGDGALPPPPTPCREDAAFSVGAYASSCTHEDYLAAVACIREYIRQGDVYQVNLSQRFRFPFQGSAFALWAALYSRNPAPFYAFIQVGDHQVLSTSMERFLWGEDDRLETRPIKGTRPRSSDPDEDHRFIQDLLSSPKDDAELSMIVDLMRNDLGRVAKSGSVTVKAHKRLESYANVHHLVSIVEGINAACSYGELLRATFPGGSITGCPKIRAMEIIDELEGETRHVYTGSIGYLGAHQNLDLNVAIRTLILSGGEGAFSVGGGVVFDSDEEAEYQETLHKGRTLFNLIEGLAHG